MCVFQSSPFLSVTRLVHRVTTMRTEKGLPFEVPATPFLLLYLNPRVYLLTLIKDFLDTVLSYLDDGIK